MYTFNAIPIKIPLVYFTGRKNNPKIHMEPQNIPNRESKFEQEEQSCRHQLPDFKLYYKVIVIKILWYCHKNQHIDQK